MACTCAQPFRFFCVLFLLALLLLMFFLRFSAFEDNFETRIFDSFRNFHATAAAAGTPLMPLPLPLPLALPMLPHFAS